MKLVENWPQLYRKYSTVALAFLVAFPTAWAESTELQALIPAHWAVRISILMAVFGFIGRFIDQTKKLPSE